MNRKGIFLMLSFSDNVTSEDFNLPDFAGVEGWCAAVW